MNHEDFAHALTLARSSGPEAMQALAEKHLPLVGMMVRRFPAFGESREELYQQGVIGLMKALRQFDPTRGTAFSTYAAALILGEMRMLHRQRTAMTVPRSEQELRQRIRHAEDALSARLQRAPSVTELANELHMEPAELMLHMEDITVVSTDAAYPGGKPLADILPDPEDWQKRVELRDILARLPTMDRQLILLRHRVGLTQSEAGQRLGMTQMQVSRREKVIRTLLKRALAE